MNVLFLSLILSEVFSAAHAASVLIIWDDSASNANTLSLKSSLEAAGHGVTLSAVSQSSYDGASPAPSAFDAVIHLNGDTYGTVMPAAGQSALLAYVQGGGGFISTEWNAYQQLQYGDNDLRELTLLDRYSGSSGTIDVTVTDSSHPVMAGLPVNFSFSSGFNEGPAHTFATDPVSVLAVDAFGSAAVAVREYMSGRVVSFHHTGNWNGFATLSDAYAQQMYLNAVNWSAGEVCLDVDSDGFPDGTCGGTDCDDSDAAVYPGAAEIAYNSADEDCDGADLCDVDGDGGDDPGCGGTDCDDGDAGVYAGAAEVWYDGVDQDCSGGSDFDQDGDGDAALRYGGGDCDDTSATTNSYASEIWYDGADGNCDGLDDFDADFDGHGSASYGGDDCDDSDPDTFPGASDDSYDGVINDCDGADEYDQDGDGALHPSGGGDDCDDANSLIFPGAPEEAADGIDQDCDGGDRCYVDADADGQREEIDATAASADLDCQDAGEATGDVPVTDCDDAAATTYDGAPELCDGVDNSCDGQVDEGCDTGPGDDTGAGDDTGSADSEPVGDDSGPQDTGKAPEGCACSTGGSGSMAGLFLMGGLLLRRRRAG